MAVMQKRRYGTSGRFVIRRALNGAVAAANAYRKYRSYTKTRTKKPQYSSTGITAQHDSRTIYRKKWMPKYKKRKWISFSRKVNAVLDNKLAPKTIVLNNLAVQTATANFQSWNAYLLYGNNGEPAVAGSGTAVGMSDLGVAIRRVSQSSSATSGSGVKFNFISAVMDLTISHADADTGPLEVDLYDVVFRKDVQDSSIAKTLVNVLSSTGTLTTGNALDWVNRGVTPFDTPQFTSVTGMTILKKVKYFMSYGQGVTYQVRDPRQRTINKLEVLDYGVGSSDNASGYSSWIKKGWTRGILIFHKTMAGFDVVGNSANLTVGCTRKYLCNIMDSSDYQDSYN